MNRDQARNLIKITFTRPFDRENFRTFILNLLNRIDESKEQAMAVPDAFKEHVRSCSRLGTYTSPKHELLDILIVNTTANEKIHRARTALRNFVSHKLNRGDNPKDAALVAFVSQTEQQWRFSYVKMDYATVKTESGKVGVEARLTPARRFSYLVGEGESSHTAQSRFVDLLQDTQSDPTLAQIEEAFSVEAVTKEFFTKYAELFEQINKALTKLVEKDKAIREEFKAKNVNTVDFAKKLMGQIVFLYFLQKKGWLGVEKGKEWGTGPRDFLRRLANGQYGKYDNFFNDVLEPLFYDTLATDRGHEAWDKRFNCRIPFLNGGLFEPLGDYDWRKTNIILPNKLFTNNEFVEEGITGTGVLDVFDRYNFTVNEAEPLEKEVAIDPEMLGKVFENLIEENRRKGLGAYYTPREIVHYMCQESLINYLDTAVNKDKPLIPRADIETFVHLGEQISHYEAVETEYRVKMPKSITENARLIDEKLADITVCDPAVGSGAFPVGMMTEIVRARMALTPYFNDPHERSPYFFKRHAIQNCLYGVDIDPGAVEIAKLRLWLSLVVDEEDVKQIKPLPNLDYRIVVGDSLIGLPDSVVRDTKLEDEIEQLKKEVFNETDHEKKKVLRGRIDGKIKELLTSAEQFTGYSIRFDYRLFFSEVFHRKGGFDVVIANPPYINTKRGIEGKSFYKSQFKAARGQFDLFTLLIERGLSITQDGLTYIVPKPFINNENYQDIRGMVLAHALTTIVIGSNVFESAGVESCVFFMSRRASKGKIRILNFHDGMFHYANLVEQSWSSMLPFGMINTELTTKDISLYKRIQPDSVCFGELVEITRGVECGKNDDVITDHKCAYPLLRGEDVEPFSATHKGFYIAFDKRDVQKFKPITLYLSEKILVRRVADSLIATFDADGYIVLNTLYCCVVTAKSCDAKLLTALLNSKLLRYWFKKTFVLTDKLFPYIRKSQLELIPIAKKAITDPTAHIPIISLTVRILAAKKRNPEADTSALEREIDQLVYKLYGLTEEEIKIVEGAKK